MGAKVVFTTARAILNVIKFSLSVMIVILSISDRFVK